MSPVSRTLVLRGLLGLGGLLMLSVLGVVLWAAVLYPTLPALDRVTEYQPRQPLQVFTRDGVEIAQFGSERRQFLPIAQIPKLMQDAVIAVEDARFREHGGIDPIGVARAVVANLNPWGLRQGASTITQQVARNFFLSSRRTAERKLKEALLAWKIEQELSKDEILELYLNQIYLGHRAYGFGAAAQVYFGKPLAQLSIAESAMLAGLPQNPGFANPITNLERATVRQRVVLARMRATGVIDEAQWTAARAEPMRIRTQMLVAVHAEHVAEMARRVVFERYGERAYAEGFKVHTSLISTDQQAAWVALRRGVLDHERKQPWRGPEDTENLPEDLQAGDNQIAQILKEYRDDEDLRVALVLQASPKEVQAQLASGELVSLSGEGLRLAQPGLGPKASGPRLLARGAVIRVQRIEKAGDKAASWMIAQWPQAQGAVVALDTATGRVRALVGGFDFTRQQFNHATQAWRQPGSSFKPFLYSAALEHGVMPSTLIEDAPLNLPELAGVPAWNPQNSDGQFDGFMSLRRALAKSKNLVSIRLVQQMGLSDARDWVARFGFDPEKQPDNLTLALGAGSTTPLQLAGAYAVLANGGHRVDPLVIERITDAQGKVLFEAPPAPVLDESLRVVPARNVFVTNSLLQEVTRSGTAARAQAQLKRPDVYGKTGTTNDAVDAWFAGFQPSVVAVVWMGYDEPRSLGQRETGGGLALPVWISYMERALRGVPVQSLPVPEGVQEVEGDWRFAEFAEGGQVLQIGTEPAQAVAPAASAPPTPPAEGPASAP
ncbi:penicillin-binding protein 1A [Ideonella sp.]|uniref:penicillin-binding protein 1A n=1 Tax=Ideonella sp. TaxID=1929293 RepID=UPI003BB80AD0